MPKKGKKSKSKQSTHEYELSDKTAYQLWSQIQEIINQNAARIRRKQKQSESESESQWEARMQGKKFRQLNYQCLRTKQLAMIPLLMKQRGLKLKKGITQAEQQVIENETHRMDPAITAAETHGGVFAITNPAVRRRQIEKVRQVEPAKNLGSRRPVITEEQQLNGIINEGSQRQKQILNRQLDSEFANQSQASDLGQSSVLDDIQPEYTLAQEKFSEAQQQQIESDIISSVSLKTVYDISALDRGRLPINDIYGRKPFETYDTSYKYDKFGNPIAYIKKPTQPIGKKYNNMKKNYIQTLQLIQTAKAYADLHNKLTKSAKIPKKK
ncbi:MAG: hypothetical protein EZS28_021307 [Streblomastix strix]|uniref:Uncharacterized protein n=1 Tax=Streblomastix strix TaxID=222440 RepID=A0A5J4VKJ4_9EUKA|nr:MAG: hypothetical protein EZS28_021307 [Streblomastix strix]